MINNDYSAYPEYKQQTINWLSPDSEELFDEHMSKDSIRKKLKELGWTKDSITYKFNDYGFRSDDFDDTGDSIVFLGCSFTLGIGVPWENTFSKIVSNNLKLKCFNLGVSGGSMDSCFRFSFYWLEKLKPKIVVLLKPDMYRKEIKTNRRVGQYIYNNILPNIDRKGFKRYEVFYKDWILEDQNAKLSTEKNLLAIKYLSDKINSKLINLYHTIDFRPDARDLMHGGIDYHAAQAKYTLERIGNYK